MVTRSVVSLANSMVMTYLPLYVLLLGGTEPMIGLMYALGSLASIILSPIGGYVADYQGRVKLIIFLIFTSSLGYLFFIFAQNWVTLALGMFFMYLFGFWAPIENALVADSLHPKERTIGFATLMTIPYGIGIVSPYIGGYLVEKWNPVYAIRVLFSIAFILGLVRTFISLRFLKETVHEVGETVSLRKLPLLMKTAYKRVLEVLRWMPKSLRSIISISFIDEVFIRMVRPFTVVYVVTNIELSPSQYGLILLIVSALRTLLMTPLGIVVNKYGRRRMLLITMALSPIPVFFLIYSKTFLLTLTLFLFTVIIDAISWPAFSALTADIVPRERRGRINAAVGESGVFIDIVGRPRPGGFLLSIAALIGSATGGYIYGYNPTYMWLIFSIGLIMCCILFAIYVHEPEKYED